MIKILFKDTLSCPIFSCDICGDMIGDLGEGAAVFADQPRRTENTKIDVLHVHKGKCHELAEQKMNSKCEWQPLGAHLYFLCANTEVDGKQLDKLKRIHGTRTA
jgi:hypothetical protein